MNLKTDSGSTDYEGDGGGNRGQECRSVTVSPFKPKQQTSGIGGHPVSFINNNRYNWQAKDYYISRVLSSLQPINLSSHRYNESRRFIPNPHSRGLRRISEELDLENDMMFVEHDEDSHFQQGSSSSKLQRPQYYETGLGSVSFDEDDDDYELLLDEGLARDGLYRGNYRNLVLLYTVVPLTTLLWFVCLALVPTLFYTTETPSRFPYPPYLPFPILEVLTATALWSLSYLLGDFLYATALFIASPLPAATMITTVLSATLQTTSNFLLRQIAIPILLIPYYSSSKHLAQQYPTWQDDAFKRVWWIALGWAAAEAVVGVKQGYESIALYKDVLVNLTMSTLTTDTEMGTREGSERDESRIIASKRPETPQKQNGREQEDVDVTPRQTNWENQRQWSNGGLTSSFIQRRGCSRSLSTDSDPMPTEDHPPITNERQPLLRTLPIDEPERLQAENEVQRDLDQLMALKNREELEEVYGIPVIHIPVFISCLHRINSVLSSLGICLLLTATYMQSSFAISTAPSSTPSFFERDLILSLHPPSASNQHLALTTLPVFFIYILLAIMHTPLILPRIGIHTFVYVELLVSLGVFFGGLGVWDALS